MTPDLIARLRELDAAATPGPWAYRPDEYDDWGVVKSPRVPVDGFPDGLRCVLAQFRHPESIHDEEVLNEHRRAKTDPWQGNAELVTFLRNAVPEILEAADQLEALRSHAEAMAKALKRAADIVERNLYRQHEKIEDVPKLADPVLAAYRSAFPEVGK
ncbi:hypothetical protein [Novosphingobium sp. HII-3]|uniref:hypothetical protein n=1 Tax=Novosphingobium sp. HII-3 TaxID=2075565 RepID=UPI001304FE1B|nr:hypothetical protein [Novosphingobium sp. HII-3]